MTLPQNVADAVKELDAAHDQRFAPWRGQWQTIRAHLMSQGAEIARLTAWAEQLSGMKFSDRMHAALKSRAEVAESRVAAANALLREIDRNGVLSQGVRARITDYMQGAGDA